MRFVERIAADEPKGCQHYFPHVLEGVIRMVVGRFLLKVFDLFFAGGFGRTGAGV